MRELYAKIYLDEDVALVVADILRSNGHDVQTTSDSHRKGKDDPDQLRYTTINGFAILTHNRVDFEDLARNYFEGGSNHSGIIISVLRPPNEIANKMLELLERFSADEMRNQLMYI